MEYSMEGKVSFKSQVAQRTWTKDSYIISTDPALIPVQKLMNVFGSDTFYWAKTLPESAMEEMLQNSLVFGLYPTYDVPQDGRDPASDGSNHNPAEPTSPRTEELLGFARCVTDFTTFSYLTDVWVDSAHQGSGLGTWLVKCVQEVTESMPHLRRSLLFTADWKRSVPFYERHMGMSVIESRHGEGLAVMESKGRGHPSYGSSGNSYAQFET